MKILIVEDEKAMSDLIAIKFKVEGYEVEQAFDLATAKQMLQAVPNIDGILTDYLLPDGNSLDLITSLRADPKFQKTPILVMTNYIEDLNLEQFKNLDVSDVLVKYQVVPAQMVEKMKVLTAGANTTHTSVV